MTSLEPQARSAVANLQEVGGETDNTDEAGEASNLGGTSGRDRGRVLGGSRNLASGNGDGSRGGDGRVVVRRVLGRRNGDVGRGGRRAVVADDGAGRDDRLGDGARAVSDGESGGLLRFS